MEGLKQWALHITEAYGLSGLFGIAFLESSVFPVPPDVLLVALLLSPSAPSPWLVAAVCTAGSVLGAGLGWVLGTVGGYPLLHRLFKEEKIQAIERMYQRYGMYAILIAAFTPLPYKIFTIASGVFRYNVWSMMLASVVGRGARFFAVVYLVNRFGSSILSEIDRALLAGTVVTVLATVAYFYWRARRQRSRQLQPTAICAELAND